jgi:hypothetical protein
MMPVWLPNRIDTYYGSDIEWEKLVAQLYKIFELDFIHQKCQFEEKLVKVDNRKIESPYEEGFWHLITRDNKETSDRLFDKERASRLPWCKPTIEHSYDDVVCFWNYVEGNNRINTYIWLTNLDYLIILQRRKNVCFLVTAYYVDGDASRRSLRKKYERRVN